MSLDYEYLSRCIKEIFSKISLIKKYYLCSVEMTDLFTKNKTLSK